MGNINYYYYYYNDENFQKRGTQTPPASRCGSWVGSFRKGCWSNSIWSRERWRHAGGCQNAETWVLCNHHSILPMYDGGFVTNLPVFVATPQRALTRKSGKPWCQSWKFSATSVTTTTSWTCWAPALKEVITLLRYNRLPSCQPLTLIYLCVSLSGPMLMITEYCSHGDLLNFLRAHAHDFMASMLSFDEGKGLAVYKNMASAHARLRRCNIPHKAIKTFIQLKHKFPIN